MNFDHFHNLCAGLCDLLSVPRFPLTETADGPVAFHLHRQGVVVDVLYSAATSPDHVYLLFGFGAIPYDDPRAPRIVLALLDFNFLLATPCSPHLGRNPETGAVAMRCILPLSDLTPGQLLAQIEDGVALALHWRSGYFLPPDTTAGSPANSIPREAFA